MIVSPDIGSSRQIKTPSRDVDDAAQEQPAPPLEAVREGRDGPEDAAHEEEARQQDRQGDSPLDGVAEQHQADHDAQDAREQGEEEPAPLATPEGADGLRDAPDEDQGPEHGHGRERGDHREAEHDRPEHDQRDAQGHQPDPLASDRLEFVADHPPQRPVVETARVHRCAP